MDSCNALHRLRAQAERGDRRAALLLSLERNADLKEYGVDSLSQYSASAPGRAVFSNPTGQLHLAVVAKDLSHASAACRAQLRLEAPAEAEAFADRCEKHLLAGGTPFVAVGSAYCLKKGHLEFSYCPFPAAGTPESTSAIRRKVDALDRALYGPPCFPIAFHATQPVPLLAAAAKPASTAASAGPPISKNLEALLSDVAPAPEQAQQAAACTPGEAGPESSSDAVVASMASSRTTTCSDSEAAAPVEAAAAVPAPAPTCSNWLLLDDDSSNYIVLDFSTPRVKPASSRAAFKPDSPTQRPSAATATATATTSNGLLARGDSGCSAAVACKACPSDACLPRADAACDRNGGTASLDPAGATLNVVGSPDSPAPAAIKQESPAAAIVVVAACGERLTGASCSTLSYTGVGGFGSPIRCSSQSACCATSSEEQLVGAAGQPGMVDSMRPATLAEVADGSLPPVDSAWTGVLAPTPRSKAIRRAYSKARQAGAVGQVAWMLGMLAGLSGGLMLALKIWRH